MNTFEELIERYPVIASRFGLTCSAWDAMNPAEQRDWALFRLSTMIYIAAGDGKFDPEIDQTLDRLETRVREIVEQLRSDRNQIREAQQPDTDRYDTVMPKRRNHKPEFGKCGRIACRAASGQVNHSYCGECRKIVEEREAARASAAKHPDPVCRYVVTAPGGETQCRADATLIVNGVPCCTRHNPNLRAVDDDCLFPIAKYQLDHAQQTTFVGWRLCGQPITEDSRYCKNHQRVTRKTAE